MAEKNIKARIIHKHDTAENWAKATSFIPKQGEIIVYDIDADYSYERFKIGDGVQNVNALPFYAGSWEDLTDKPFGEVEGKNYIVEETSIVLGEGMGWTETSVSTTRPFSGFVEGQVYYVVFDGEVYPAEYSSDIDGLGIEAIDIEVYYGGNDEMTVCTASSDPRKGETHTFGMYTTELVTAQLDEQYIPDTIARVSDIEVHNTSETTHSDIRTSINNLSSLVGDMSVSEQINAAAANNQSDWDVNDETSPAYIKNKPFGEFDNKLLYNAKLTVTEIGGMYGVIDQSDAARSFTVESGATYTIIFDGVTYSCVCDDGYIGNKNLLSSNFDDTEEPFLMMRSGESGLVLATFDTSTATHDVEIYGLFVKTIDWKYLPEFEYVTASEGDSRWASEMQFRRINGRLTYKGKTYETNYKYFMYFLTDAGLWSIGLVAGGAQIPSSGDFRMNYDSSDGTLSFYWRQETETTEIETTMNATLRIPTTGEIISRHTGVSTLTIGAYEKKSHNVPFYINKSNPQDELVINDFNDFVEIPVPTTVDNGKVLGVVDGSLNMVDLPVIDEVLSSTSTNAVQNKIVNAAISNLNTLVGDTAVSEQIAAANMIYVGPNRPEDPNIKVWINTAEEGTGIVPVLPRIASITLAADGWTGSAEPYSQVVEINTVTSATKIDLQPTASQIVSLQNAEITLMIENNGGVVTCYAIGNKPVNSYTMQVLLQEVAYV